MSLANDLLKNLSAPQVDELDDTIIIDHYTRSIGIPKHITNLGVENDDDVLRLNFRMPRYFGKVDLSTFSIRINYINAAGIPDAYDVVDAAIVGDNITFSWEVGPVAAAYKGVTKFTVDMVKLKSNGDVDKSYNTTIASLPVLEGLEASESMLLAYSDLIEQWKRELFGIGDTEEASIKEVSQTEQENIANKGAEVLATIPADYTTAVNMANSAVRTKADAIVCSAEGETIMLNDSSDDYLRGLSVFGKTTQVKTTGAQKLPFPYYESSLTRHGVTFTVNDDGSISMSGTNTATDNVSCYFMLHSGFSATGTYTYKCYGLPSNCVTNIYYRGDVVGDDAVLLDLYSVNEYGIVIRIPSGATVNATVYPMLNEGDVALPYEPYTGGIPGPNPEYPRELTSVNEPTINVYGNNLFPVSETTAYNVTGAPQADGSITYTGTSNGNAWHAYQDCPISVSGKYAMTVQTTNGTNKGSLVQLFNSRGAIVKSWIIVDENHLAVFDAEAGGKVRWNIGVEPDEVVNTNVKLMLNVGDTALPWEPYVGQQTMVTNRTLSGIPVTSGGNYTDSNGQQWVCDEIDFERGVYVKRINIVTFENAQGDITEYPGGSGLKRLNFNLPSNPTFLPANSERDPAYCTAMNANSYPTIGSNALDVSISPYKAGGIYMRYDRFATIAEFVEWATSVDLKYAYILKTPIESPLTTEEIAAYRALHVNRPNTTVLSDTNVGMRVSYNADTETWIKNLIDEKITAAVVKL